MDEITVSVMITVSGNEKNLKQCMDSVLKQTMPPMEVICVADSAEAASLQLLREYELMEQRVRVLTLPAQTVGKARNYGLSQATGKYVVFLSSDDLPEPKLLEEICCRAEKTGADIVTFDFDEINALTGESLPANNNMMGMFAVDTDGFCRESTPECLFQLIRMVPWCALYRRQFVQREQLQFQERANTDDEYFTLMTAALAERITYVQKLLVHHRKEKKSPVQNRESESPLCFLDAFLAAYDELNRRNLYRQLEKSFCNAFLDCAANRYHAVSDQKTRLQILEGLCSRRLQETGILEHPASYFYVPIQLFLVQSAPKVVAWKHALDRQYTQERVQKLRTAAVSAPIVSVIIPVYNAEGYLEACLRSVCGQTLQNLEIICIDDGSEDRSLQMLLDWAEKDNRISVYSQKNAGLAVSRNRGIAAARGQYLQLLDAADSLLPMALEELVNKAEKEQLDSLFYHAESICIRKENTAAQVCHTQCPMKKQSCPDTASGAELLDALYRSGSYCFSACTMLLRRELLTEQNICFIPGILHGDSAFLYRALLLSKKAGVLSECLCRRLAGTEPGAQKQVSFADVYGHFLCYLQMRDFYIEHASELSQWEYPDKEPDAALSRARSCLLQSPPEDICITEALPLQIQLQFRHCVVDYVFLQQAINAANQKP